VCPLERWPADAVMQRVAAAVTISEVAFLVPQGHGHGLRWFTPATEVELCGHATLAAAHVLFTHLGLGAPVAVFHTRSGELCVAREGSRLRMDFPAWPVRPCPEPTGLAQALGARPRETHAGRNLLCLYDDAGQVRALRPDFAALARLEFTGVIVTAPGADCDFVSHYFAPAKGVGEDPVTGSAHCSLAPFWAPRLGRSELAARQLSARGGELACIHKEERVELIGQAVTVLEGRIDSAVAAESA